ncbi:MAG: nitroreductase family deazaflavin-dependent oxidoreductase [Myxococcota bacterium]|nr:nitroreductase family deazaflavin-dependent oxidoreductase [Myxococcota bacterium]
MNALQKSLLKAFVAGHVRLYQLSRGRIGGRIGTLPVALLTTTGRKTGKKRTVPLGSFEDQGDVLVIASFGGSPEHPAWYNNLLANPTVAVQIGERAYEARAEIVTGAERGRLWKMVVERAPNFAGYQKKTTREIPIVRLRRV